MTEFTTGSLVKARGREWVVAAIEGELLMLRPLGGTDDEVAGVYLPLETVVPAQFALPDPTKSGDFQSCRLLRNAMRLGFRSSAGPFRCYGSLAVEPRHYRSNPGPQSAGHPTGHGDSRPGLLGDQDPSR